MTDRIKINADLEFVEGVLKSGGQDLKKCYQCSTCTVACPLTPEGAPFPRKEMISAQWGIKDKLVKNMDAWLCFHCNDCSDQCPRGAKPGDVMAAIRNMTIKHYSVPSFIGSLTSTFAGVLLLLLLPLVLLAAVIYGINVGDNFKFLSEETIVFSKMFPVMYIDMVFVTTALFAVITAYAGIKKFIAGLKEAYPPTGNGESLADAIKGTIGDILSHRQFKECGINASRNLAHMLTLYGFIGLAITTGCVVAIHYVFAPLGIGHDTPLEFFHPVKILGNVSGIAAVVGISMIGWRRMTSPDVGTSVSFDWTFIGVVFLIMVTGGLAQITRESGLNPLAYVVYYFHLVFVFFLFAYMPHSKFAHMVYRTVALVYSRYSGREKTVGLRLLEMKEEEAAKKSA